MTDAKLLPCPFCGAEPLLDHATLVRDTYHWVRCIGQNCAVVPSGMQCLKQEDAIAAWNRRASAAPVAAGERKPFKMLVDREWLRKKIEAEADCESVEAGILHPEAPNSAQLLRAQTVTDAMVEPVQFPPAIRRSVETRLFIGADSTKDFCDALRLLANKVERYGLSASVVSGGSNFSYICDAVVDVDISHDDYFKCLDEHLAAQGQREDKP